MPDRTLALVLSLVHILSLASGFFLPSSQSDSIHHPICAITSISLSTTARKSRKHLMMKASDQNREEKRNSKRPKLVVFDLDGCLWRPEMYELIYFMGNSGAPFRPSKEDPDILLSRKGEPVYLLGDVRDIMRELHLNEYWQGVPVGISSRTNEPNWARELLEKFTVDKDSVTTSANTSNKNDNNSPSRGSFTLRDVFDGPIQIASDSKIDHFYRIHEETKVAMGDMIFIDNELGNCEMVASLGVTVGYCPGGVTKELWDATLEAFPCGTVVQLSY